MGQWLQVATALICRTWSHTQFNSKEISISTSLLCGKVLCVCIYACVCVYEGYKQHIIVCEKYNQMLVDYKEKNYKNNIHSSFFPHPHIIVGGSQRKKHRSLSLLTFCDWKRGRSQSTMFLNYPELVLGRELDSVLFKFSWLKILRIKIPRCDPRTCVSWDACVGGSLRWVLSLNLVYLQYRYLKLS